MRPRATLGNRTERIGNPKGVVSPTAFCWKRDCGFDNRAQPRLGLLNFRTITQGSSFLATLGFGAESLWDSPLTTMQRRLP